MKPSRHFAHNKLDKMNESMKPYDKHDFEFWTRIKSCEHQEVVTDLGQEFPNQQVQRNYYSSRI